MELDNNYFITTQPTKSGQYQAFLQKKKPFEGGTMVGESMYSSQEYPTEEQAYQEAKDFYDVTLGNR